MCQYNIEQEYPIYDDWMEDKIKFVNLNQGKISIMEFLSLLAEKSEGNFHFGQFVC